MCYDDLGNILETNVTTDKTAVLFWAMDDAGQLHLMKQFDPDNIKDWCNFFDLMLKFSRN